MVVPKLLFEVGEPPEWKLVSCIGTVLLRGLLADGLFKHVEAHSPLVVRARRGHETSRQAFLVSARTKQNFLGPLRHAEISGSLVFDLQLSGVRIHEHAAQVRDFKTWLRCATHVIEALKLFGTLLVSRHRSGQPGGSPSPDTMPPAK